MSLCKDLIARLGIGIVFSFVTVGVAQADIYEDGLPNSSAYDCYRGARAPGVIQDLNNVPIISSSTQKMDIQTVEKAIKQGATATNWNVVSSQGNILRLNILVRGKHTVIVDVVYDEKSYSIKYVQSINMNQADCNGVRWIHPNYNRWVASLNNAIQRALRDTVSSTVGK